MTLSWFIICQFLVPINHEYIFLIMRIMILHYSSASAKVWLFIVDPCMHMCKQQNVMHTCTHTYTSLFLHGTLDHPNSYYLIRILCVYLHALLSLAIPCHTVLPSSHHLARGLECLETRLHASMQHPNILYVVVK